MELIDLACNTIFKFFYSILDMFLPQKKFHYYSFGGQARTHFYTVASGGFQTISKLLHASNDLTQDPEKNINRYYNFKTEYKNFYLEEKIVEHIGVEYLYQYYLRGAEGLIIGIACENNDDIERTLTTRYQISLCDILERAKCDDRLTIPSDSFLKCTPARKDNFRPILFFIHSTFKQDNITQIKSIIARVIEESGYEEHNTMIVVHSDEEESNLYEGLEWLFIKRSD